MKDGAIVQAVIWSNCKALARRHHVIQCILSHVLQNQLAGIADPDPQIEVADGQPLDKVIFRKHHSEASWKLAYDAFERVGVVPGGNTDPKFGPSQTPAPWSLCSGVAFF